MISMNEAAASKHIPILLAIAFSISTRTGIENRLHRDR
jgi:hypothetical protein